MTAPPELAAVLGGSVGLVLALTGSGGSIIAVPVLMAAYGWDVRQAAPVALLAVAVAAGLGAAMGLKAGIVRWRAAAWMAAVGAVLSPLGTTVAHRMPARPLALVFSGVLLYVAQRLYRQASRQRRAGGAGVPLPTFRPNGAPPCRIDPATGRFDWTLPCILALANAGALTGFLSGLLGVGGGFVVVPALHRASDLPMNTIVATSLMTITLVSGSAVLGAAASGRFDAAIGMPFAAGAAAGMLAGRVIAARLSGPRLQQIFALVATVAAGWVALQAWAG